MKLPNGNAAVIEISKLRDYCLNPQHPRGRHKAKVFKAALELLNTDASHLRDALAVAASEGDAVSGASDEFGTRYIIDFDFTHGDRSAIVRSSWIIRSGEVIPRFVTCYVI